MNIKPILNIEINFTKSDINKIIISSCFQI